MNCPDINDINVSIIMFYCLGFNRKKNSSDVK